jgi:hypothetical protein
MTETEEGQNGLFLVSNYGVAKFGQFLPNLMKTVKLIFHSIGKTLVEGQQRSRCKPTPSFFEPPAGVLFDQTMSFERNSLGPNFTPEIHPERFYQDSFYSI